MPNWIQIELFAKQQDIQQLDAFLLLVICQSAGNASISIIAISSADAEYIALSTTAKESTSILRLYWENSTDN